MAVHVVQKGDCITSIADQHGFYCETIWSHAENAGLRGVRSDPHTLMEHDRVFIPDLVSRSVDCVTARWPAVLPPQAFGIDEIRVTTSHDPASGRGGVESVELVFSSPERVRPAPLPLDIPYTFLFAGASPDGVSVELHFNAAGACSLSQIDGAVLFEDGTHETLTGIPLQWTSKMPELFAGAFDAEDDDADPPFYLLAIRKKMGEFHPVLEGLEAVLIHQAELTCNLATENFDFVGQSQEDVEIAGLRCSEVTISIKWRVDGKTPMPHILVLRGFAALREPTFFRAALVWRVDRWISALEANHSSQTWGEARPLAALVHALPGFVTPVRLVSDGSIEPQILRLDEQRRGSENDFDELIGG